MTTSLDMPPIPDIQIFYFLNETENDPDNREPKPFDDQVITAVEETAAELDLDNDS